MDFAVKRLEVGEGGSPNYHLLDSNGILLMVADQNVAPRPDERRQVRLAQPDGRLLATIDLPLAAKEEGRSEEGDGDYAIVHDYAVYAILCTRQRSDTVDEVGGAYFTLEVEGEKWLALPHPDLLDCYAIYDEAPSGLHPYDTFSDLDLPDNIGHICLTSGEYAFRVELDPDRLQQTGLIVLALAFLIDLTLQKQS